MNRKLIRPNLMDVKKDREAAPERERGNGGMTAAPPQKKNPTSQISSAPPRPAAGMPDGAGALNSKAKKAPPPVETNAEVFYYKKQIDSHTTMIIVLQDGEEIEGTIEWYDKSALKINRKNAPNILLLKHNIKYMFKGEERAAESLNEEIN